MNKKEKETYYSKAIQLKLDLIINGNKTFDSLDKSHLSYFPKKLYKHRYFDEYTVDMIKNNYIYLTPAVMLDDQFECRPDYDHSKVINGNEISNYFIELLADMLSEVGCSFSKNEIKELARKCINRDKTLNENKVRLELRKKTDELTDIEINELVKCFVALASGAWISDANEKGLKNMLNIFDSSKDRIGIGSLTETNKSQVMWTMYSKNYEGYCIEYDFTDDIDSMINTFPVLYGDRHKTNMIFVLTQMLLDEILCKFSNGALKNIDSIKDYTRLFVTKYKEWDFQKEWRIIGDANYKFEVPKIKAIYLGKNVSNENKAAMIKLCKEQNINLYIQCDNFTDLTISFNKI